MKRTWRKRLKYSLQQIGIVTIVLIFIIAILILILSQLQPVVLVSESGKQPCPMCDITPIVDWWVSIVILAVIALLLTLIVRFMPIKIIELNNQKLKGGYTK
jgi:membrane protein implicated in regulation of membrane protease activity